MKKYITITITIALLVISFYSCEDSKEIKTFTKNDINIIPKPAELTLKDGSFNIGLNTKIVAHDSLINVANILADKLRSAGVTFASGQVTVKNSFEFVSKKGLENEAYELIINNDKVIIAANSLGGFLYGVQSILQLLPAEVYSNTFKGDLFLPALEIKDKPRFGHRGLMLDLSRHFFPKEYILKTIDRLAMHKMNVLHLHLVDDQGWRMEIKKYPKLTEVGAWRVDQEDKHWDARDDNNPNEKGTYGGFLTQKELKEIVAYAAQNNVEVIPEIEMPAHVTCAVAAYPELACFSWKKVAVPSGGVWPITDIYCAGKETTFEFLEDVLTEVMEVFPSQYIHIGGDEATKTNWEKCWQCKKRMREEGLTDVEELQSYFIKRIEKFINSKGKKLIGWDEILEGGLAPEATVMSWRGFEGGVEAAEQGHDVIMTPGDYCYFDHYQGPQNVEPLAQGGFVPLNKVYQFEPIVEGMSDEAARHLLGAQANLWSEFVPTASHSEYMLYPRLAALSETIWSPKASRDWNDFSKRLKRQFERYEALGINYAKSAYLVTADMEVDLESKSVKMILKNEFPNSDIRYSLNQGTINGDAKFYKNPIKITQTTLVSASLFDKGSPVGKVFTNTVKFHRGVAKKVDYKTLYSDSYKGAGEYTLVNALRGSKNFHDGQWQAWLKDNMEVVIDLVEPTVVSKITVGAMENQGPGIYYPKRIEVYTSDDGKYFKRVGKVERPYAKNAASELNDFIVNFEEQRTRFVKVKVTNLRRTPSGGSVWLFIDEILVE